MGGRICDHPKPLQIHLLGDLKRVLDPDSEVAHGAFELDVTEQKLGDAEVASFIAYLRGFRPPQRLCAIGGRIKPNAGIMPLLPPDPP